MNQPHLTEESAPPTVVIDTEDNVFVCGKEISRGGQGVVYRLKDNDLALKLLHKGTRSAGRKVRTLPLPDGIGICTPVSILKDGRGYVMKLLSSMGALQELLTPSSTGELVKPPYLAEADEKTARDIICYARSGGLRRRLGILAQAAAILSRVHALGIYYGDISANNVFCQQDAESCETWWIDPDNLDFEQPMAKRRSCYTPGYAAPEVLDGSARSSTRSDAYSFAILAHILLTLNHPFMGAATLDEDEDWADDTEVSAEEKALQGALPWIFDPKDKTNAAKIDLGPLLVMTPQLYAWFAQVFCEGRRSAWLRPTLLHAAFCLAQACDATLACPSCGHSWLPLSSTDTGEAFTAGEECPYCEQSSAKRIECRSYVPQVGGSWLPLWVWRHEMRESAPCLIPHRAFFPFSPQHHADAAALLRLEKGQLLLDFSDCQALCEPEEEGHDGVWRPVGARREIPWEMICQGIHRWRFRTPMPLLIEIEGHGSPLVDNVAQPQCPMADQKKQNNVFRTGE